MFSSTGEETGKFFDPHVMLRVSIMQKKQIDMMTTITFGTQVVDAVAFVFRIQRDNVYADFGVYFLKFRYVFHFDWKSYSVEIQGRVILIVIRNAIWVVFGGYKQKTKKTKKQKTKNNTQ